MDVATEGSEAVHISALALARERCIHVYVLRCASDDGNKYITGEAIAGPSGSGSW